MKAHQVLIVCVFDDVQNPDEIKGGGEALWTRYLQRPPPRGLRLTHVKTSDPAWGEPPDISHVKGKDVQPPLDGTVGMYVYGHGSYQRQLLGNLKHDELAAVIATKLGIGRLDKLCLLSCKLGQDTPAPTPDAQPGYSYLRNLCASLASHGLTPKVAGWNDFITVAYTGMASNHHPRKNKNTRETVEVVEKSWSSTTVGRKVAHGLTGQINSKPAFVNDEMRQAKKSYWTCVDGNVTAIAYGDWHDK